MSIKLFRKNNHFIKRGVVGYFAPVIAAKRLYQKKQWNYFHQLKVVYRYAFWK